MVKDYALALKERGHEVCIVVLEDMPDMPNELAVKNANIEIISIGCYPKSSKLLDRLWSKLLRTVTGPDLIPSLRLKKIIKNLKPDVVHIHLHMMQYCYQIRNSIEGIKLIYTCHNEPKVLFREKTKATKKSLKWFVEQGRVQIIALHSNMEEEIKCIFNGADVVTLNNPVDLKRFILPKKDNQSIRKDLEIPENAFVIGNVGRFSKQKNQEWIVEVFAECIKKKQDAFLLLIGSGYKMDLIKKQLREKNLEKHCLILSDRNDIPELDNAMNVFVLPSLYEGFPISLIEAQSVGLKCVVSDRITPDAVLTDNVCMLSLNESAETWSKAILTNEFKPVRPTHNLEDFDINRVVDKLIQIYSE